jgi:FAD/FMN-containing dehydrogenase
MSIHLTHIVEVGKDFVRVEPGVRWSDLQAELKKHGCQLPEYAASKGLTVGEAMLPGTVHEIEIVLANGDIARFRPLSPLQLEGTMHRYTFEGKIYRDMVKLQEPDLSKDFSLVDIVAGSQGALGFATEIMLRTSGSAAAMPRTVRNEGWQEAFRHVKRTFDPYHFISQPITD